MSLGIGFDTQTPSLPHGGGALNGLGETFTPDLSTGTGTYTIRLDWPNGPNDIGPRLVLRYDTGNGNGPFGLGWSLPLPRLLRSTARGYPRYTDEDRLMLEGAGELLPLGGGRYRPQVDGDAWHIQADGDGFRLTDREGLYYFLGTTPAGRLSDAGGGRVFAWHLERFEDPLGNMVTFGWRRDGDQLYLERVAYGAYVAHLEYEPRPDVLRWGRAGFLITTALRCRAIELHLPEEAQPLLRRWTLAYSQAPGNGTSLLNEVVLSGFDADGAQLDAPPLRLGYSGFAPRELIRMQGRVPGAAPGPLVRDDQRVELVDWNGDGLPDLLEVGPGGHARVWPNTGDGAWGRPQGVGQLPMFAAPGAAVGLADMDGDGCADLVRMDRPAQGYLPRLPGGGFGRPVAWRRAPAAPLGGPGTRLVDLDGDGVLDLLASSGDHLALYYRQEPDGWVARPRIVPRGQAPDVSLADPHVFLADMTGDGGPDLVRVTGGGVIYWPYLGDGRWERAVTMADPPQLPFDLRLERLLLSDIDGDGCADLIYLDAGRVLYWVNQAGMSFSSAHVIDYVPASGITAARLADMRGGGAPGLLWSTPGPLRGAHYFYLDFVGDAKPYLLSRIDTGLGLTTTIQYTTSARQAAAAARAGEVWGTFLPVVVPVVAGLRDHDAVSGRVSETRYHYHAGRYDGVLREFAGFGRVDEEHIGDATAPTLRTTTWFHVGLDPARTGEPRTSAERNRLRALRGRILRQERYGLDGSPEQHLPYDRLEQTWTVVVEETPAGQVYVPRLTEQTRLLLERQAAPAALVTTRHVAWDAAGNLVDSTQTSSVPGDPDLTRSLRTLTEYAQDPAGRFLSRPWRVQQFDRDGGCLADTVTLYDDETEGRVGAHGLVTRRDALVLTDAQAAEVYGVDLPDFAALGYFRRPEEDGWWITQARYRRIDDAEGLHGQVTGPLGAVTALEFDAYKTYPARIVDPRGNTLTAEHDYRVCRVNSLTDAAGAVAQASYDSLARPLAVIDPGDTPGLPTVSFAYAPESRPVEIITRRRAVSGRPETMESRLRFDGSGQLLERRERDDGGEVVVESLTYSARGLLARAYAAHRAPGPDYTPPDETAPHTVFRYDALGRIVEQRHPDGTWRGLRYAPLTVEETDEEDNNPDSPHAGTPMRRRYDADGRVYAVEENLAGRLVTSTYTYDAMGNLMAHRDALGHTVRTWYDLLGRALRVERPEGETWRVFDAAGNPVETRTRGGTPVFTEYDECSRPLAVRYAVPHTAPAVRFTYHDTGRPAPPEAGAHTRGGRCVRVDDEGGTTVFDYDARGRVTLKRSTPAGMAQSYSLNFRYRADGQIESLVYPDEGNGRLTLRYEYNRRGLLVRVPTLIRSIEYEADGRRKAVTYANDTREEVTYDTRRRLVAMRLSGPAGELRAVDFTLDGTGNLLRIASPDPRLAATYTYDDLYRLTGAEAGDGPAWSYHYDDAGNLTFKSDVGDYHYGQGGAPATALTTAGADHFTYTAAGQMRDTPWGVQSFDSLGRLARVSAPGGVGHTEFRYNYAGARVATRRDGPMAPAVDRLTPDPLYAIEAGQLILHLFDGTRIVARQAGAALHFLHTDHLGSLAMVTDAAGVVVDRLRYDPYGQLLQRDGGGPLLPFGYATGELDPSSGLLYLGARYYQPRLGRFISPDVVVSDPYNPAAWSAYAYCAGNPVSRIDPSGRSFWGIFLASVAIVALVALMIVFPVSAAVVGAVLIGGVLGGVAGGVAAYRQGGSTGEIVTGAFVGAAVGGWTAYIGFGLMAGAKAASAVGLSSGLGQSIAAGAVNGAVNGAAMGFAAGFAGGAGSADEVLTRIWQRTLAGAAVGAAVGAALGAAGHLAFKQPEPAAAGPSSPASKSGNAPPTAADEITRQNDIFKDMAYRTGDVPPPSGLEGMGKQLADKAPDIGEEILKRTAGEPTLAEAATLSAFHSPLMQVPLVDLSAGSIAVLLDDIVQYIHHNEVKIGPFKPKGKF